MVPGVELLVGVAQRKVADLRIQIRPVGSRPCRARRYSRSRDRPVDARSDRLCRPVPWSNTSGGPQSDTYRSAPGATPETRRLGGALLGSSPADEVRTPAARGSNNAARDAIARIGRIALGHDAISFAGGRRFAQCQVRPTPSCSRIKLAPVRELIAFVVGAVVPRGGQCRLSRNRSG